MSGAFFFGVTLFVNTGFAAFGFAPGLAAAQCQFRGWSYRVRERVEERRREEEGREGKDAQASSSRAHSRPKKMPYTRIRSR